MSKTYLLAIDQGTTKSKAIVFQDMNEPAGSYQIELKNNYPHNGWVEQAPEEIWQSVLKCCKQAILTANITASEVAAIGITNQRETTLIWDRKSGEPIYPAIVWQDRRTANSCKQLASDINAANQVNLKTGLLIDPYFSATKIAWILDHVDGARKRAEKGELAFGTIDTYLLWKLTNGKEHATDATNASRTLLFNIQTQSWDEELLTFFNIPKKILPIVRDSNAPFGMTDASLLGAEIPITGIAGDQHAATVGQACFTPGMIKSTYGTGCFVVLNTGDQIIRSTQHLISTIAYRINGKVSYALEGSIFSAGSTIQWLCNTLKILSAPCDSETLAQNISNTNGVYLVPAFTGLGAPYWQPHARGALVGMTRETGPEHITRAALEAVCYQTQDLLMAMSLDFSQPMETLRVDGGMVENNWMLQYLADITQLTVKRPTCIQTTAQGAAYLAGLGIGIFQDENDIARHWTQSQAFMPKMANLERNKHFEQWHIAINQTLAGIGSKGN